MALPEELNRLLEAGVHFGHQAKRWNPKMKKFIFGKRSGIYIIDLEKTLEKIKEAEQFLVNVVKDSRDILFVATKKQAQGIIKEVAESCEMPYVTDRWVGGLLTNFNVISSRIERYKQLLQQREKGKFERLSKKEVVRLNKELEKMERNFAGVKNMKDIPAALFIVDPKREILAAKEAQKVGIPIVALIDTDSDPEVIDYPIPGNDDALKSIKTVISFVMDAIGEILAVRKKKETKEKEEKEVKEKKAEKLPEKYDDGRDEFTQERERRPRRRAPRGSVER